MLTTECNIAVQKSSLVNKAQYICWRQCFVGPFRRPVIIDTLSNDSHWVSRIKQKFLCLPGHKDELQVYLKFTQLSVITSISEVLIPYSIVTVTYTCRHNSLRSRNSFTWPSALLMSITVKVINQKSRTRTTGCGLLGGNLPSCSIRY